MYDSSGELALWRLELSKFEFHIFYSGVFNSNPLILCPDYQPVEMARKLDCPIAVFTITTNISNTYGAEQEREARESYDEPTEQEHNPYVPKLYVLAHLVDGNETEVLLLRDFIEAQSAASACRQAVTSFGKPDSSITY